MSAAAIRLIAEHLRSKRRNLPTRTYRRPHLMQRQAEETKVPWWGLDSASRRVQKTPNQEKLLAAYRGWVYKAVTVIANRCAEIRQTINLVTPLDDGSEERNAVPKHPYYDLMGPGGMRRPNPMSTSYNLRKLTQMDLELVGNAYWFKVRDSVGIPREIWRLRPDKMKPKVDPATGILLGWVWSTQYGKDSKVVPFPRTEIVHFSYPHPLADPYEGMGPLQAAAMAFDIDEANRRYQRQFFDQGAQISVILSTEQKLEDEEVDRILDDFEVKHSGLDNAWLPIVLSGGLEATPMTALNKELEALGLMEFTRDDILSTFGVPKTKVGLGENINQANANALDVMFNRETINPRLKNNEETIEADMLVDYPQPTPPRRIELDHDNPVPEDREFELRETIDLHREGVITTNLALQRHGFPMYENEGGYGDKVHVPMGIDLIDPNEEEVEEDEDEDAGATEDTDVEDEEEEEEDEDLETQSVTEDLLDLFRQSMTMQTLIFPKRHWASAAACKKWAKDHDFKSDDVDETSQSWRLRQRNPGDFKKGSLRTICLKGAPKNNPSSARCKVKGVLGKLK